MQENIFLIGLILIPFIGLLLSILLPIKDEKLFANISILTAGLSFVGYIYVIFNWGLNNFQSIYYELYTIYRTDFYEFTIAMFFDKTAAMFGLVGSVLAFSITYFCRYYMHREIGFRRFFQTILFFYFGYNFILLSGNFETLFIGWEIIGLSSFLLIAFYRDRYLPVKNAVKVFSIYRIGDVGLILAMWLSHHLWHENISFWKLHNYQLVHDMLSTHSMVGFFISLFILMAAMAKSAQFPFSSWLPRAMEGPTPSSAIFYGALSVHFGVFLLIRTYAFWEHQISIRVLIALIGVLTVISSAMIGRVQSSMKAQIAYASISQIGIMFIEVAFGWTSLALIHFAGNAFLRSYQLLISPSAVTYLVREQLYQYTEDSNSFENKLSRKIRYKWFIWNLREWNLDQFLADYVFSPLKRIGRNLDFLNMRNVFIYILPIYVFGWVMYYYGIKTGVVSISGLPHFFAVLGLIMVLKAFSERKDPILAWTLLFLNHLFISLALTYNEEFSFQDLFMYISGIGVAYLLGLVVLHNLKKKERAYFSLNRFYGHVYEHKTLHAVYLIACLGIMCFPITNSFMGVDLAFSHIHENQFFLALFSSLSFVVSGIAVIRMYARLFLGPHVKTYHSTSIKTA